MARNNDYWKKRMELLELMTHEQGKELLKNLDFQYRKILREINVEMTSWYRRFADNNEISMAKARKMLNANELEEFHWDVKDYIRYGKENAINQRWMQELENASARVHISRLDALKIQLRHRVEMLYKDREEEFDNLLGTTYKHRYYHTAFEIQKGFNVGYSLHSINDNQLKRILGKPWASDGKTYSDRIWANRDQLASKIQTHLTQSVVMGKSPDRVIKEISEEFLVDRKKAGRLVMTESAAFASIGQEDCYKDLGVERYEIVATLDFRTSTICRELDGRVFDMKDYVVSITAPPFHPWCRTVTAPHFDDEFSIGSRAARGVDGKIEYVSSDMKYDEWYNKYVKANKLPKVLKVESNSYLQSQIKFKDDNNFKFIPSDTIIENVNIIAGEGVNKKINDLKRLTTTYGEGNWTKRVGKVESEKYIFDIHWYQKLDEIYEQKIKAKKRR